MGGFRQGICSSVSNFNYSNSDNSGGGKYCKGYE